MKDDATIRDVWARLLKTAHTRFERDPSLRSQTTFRDLAYDTLGKREYTQLIESIGYTDYLNADVVDTLEDYNVEDTLDGGKIIRIPWDLLIDKLTEAIGLHRINTNHTVHRIEKHNGYHVVHFEHQGAHSKLLCRRLVLGTTANILYKLLHQPIYHGISCQSYSVCSCVPRNSHHWTACAIIDLKYFFWKCGTDFYRPLSSAYPTRKHFVRAAQRPADKLWVVGEAVSKAGMGRRSPCKH